MILAALGFATSSRAGCTLGTVAELPVIMEGGQPTVATTINGSSERFVANTGAGFSIIFNRPAQVLHCPTQIRFFNWRSAVLRELRRLGRRR